MTPYAPQSLSILAALLSFFGTAYGLYAMSQTLGLPRPYLAFIPVAQTYRMGALADEQSRLSGDTSAPLRRKLLLWHILHIAVTTAIATLLALLSLMTVLPEGTVSIPEREMELMRTVLTPLCLTGILVWLGVYTVLLVFTCRALHRILRLFAPRRATLLTVLAVLLPLAGAIILSVLSNRSPVLPEPADGGTPAADSP